MAVAVHKSAFGAPGRSSAILELLQGGWRFARPRTVRVSALPPDTEDLAQLAAAARRGKVVDVELPAELAMSRTIALPRSAAAHVREAIEQRLRQTLPDKAQGLIWAIGPPQYSGDAASYEVLVFRAGRVSQVGAVITEAGGKPGEVRVAREGFAPVLSPSAEHRPGTFRSLLTAAGFVVLPVLAAAALIDLRRAAYEGANHHLAEDIAFLEQRATELRRDADARGEAARQLEGALAEFARDSGKPRLLLRLTRLLPDTVWISELSIAGNELRLSGHTSDHIEEVVALLENDDGIGNVRLDGPVAVDTLTQRARFDLTSTLEHGGLAE